MNYKKPEVTTLGSIVEKTNGTSFGIKTESICRDDISERYTWNCPTKG